VFFEGVSLFVYIVRDKSISIELFHVMLNSGMKYNNRKQ